MNCDTDILSANLYIILVASLAVISKSSKENMQKDMNARLDIFCFVSIFYMFPHLC